MLHGCQRIDRIERPPPEQQAGGTNPVRGAIKRRFGWVLRVLYENLTKSTFLFFKHENFAFYHDSSSIHVNETEAIEMAQAYPYTLRVELRMEQHKCTPSMLLDKPRIWLDFNGFYAVDESSGAPIYLFSQADIVNDSTGADVELIEGPFVSVFDDDLDDDNNPDALLADGVILRNDLGQFPTIKWLLRLSKPPAYIKSRAPYVCWMSDHCRQLREIGEKVFRIRRR